MRSHKLSGRGETGGGVAFLAETTKDVPSLFPAQQRTRPEKKNRPVKSGCEPPSRLGKVAADRPAAITAHDQAKPAFLPDLNARNR